jgi:hypothetical protein
MEAVCLSKMSGCLWTTQCYTPENPIFDSHHDGNLTFEIYIQIQNNFQWHNINRLLPRATGISSNSILPVSNKDVFCGCNTDILCILNKIILNNGGGFLAYSRNINTSDMSVLTGRWQWSNFKIWVPTRENSSQTTWTHTGAAGPSLHRRLEVRLWCYITNTGLYANITYTYCDMNKRNFNNQYITLWIWWYRGFLEKLVLNYTQSRTRFHCTHSHLI